MIFLACYRYVDYMCISESKIVWKYESKLLPILEFCVVKLIFSTVAVSKELRRYPFAFHFPKIYMHTKVK